MKHASKGQIEFDTIKKLVILVAVLLIIFVILGKMSGLLSEVPLQFP